MRKSKGIVIRSVNVGEYDKMLTVLTHDLGQISVFAKGVKSLKNKNFAGIQPLCYSEFVVKDGKTNVYLLSQCQLIESFYSLRESVQGLSYATYFCDLVSMFIKDGMMAEEELKLLLNTIHVLTKRVDDADILKCVFELKLLDMCGLVPIIEDGDEEKFYFHIQAGEINSKYSGEKSVYKISKDTVDVIKYIIYSNLKDALYFKTNNTVINELNTPLEEFLRFHLGNLPKSLSYLHKITQLNIELKKF